MPIFIKEPEGVYGVRYSKYAAASRNLPGGVATLKKNVATFKLIPVVDEKKADGEGKLKRSAPPTQFVLHGHKSAGTARYVTLPSITVPGSSGDEKTRTASGHSERAILASLGRGYKNLSLRALDPENGKY